MHGRGGSSASSTGGKREHRIIEAVVASLVVALLVGLLGLTGVLDRFDKKPEASLTVTSGLNKAYADEDVDLVVGVRNDGDGDIRGGTLAVGSTACPGSVNVDAHGSAPGVTCAAPALQAEGARDGVVLKDADGSRLAKSGPLQIRVVPAPCPSLKIGTRAIGRMTRDELVANWNAAVRATRAPVPAGQDDACPDLDRSWEIDSPTPTGARIGSHSRLNWTTDDGGGVTRATLVISAGTTDGPDDSLSKVVARGVFATAVAHDRAQAVGLLKSWAASCGATSDVTASVEGGSDNLVVEFCP